MSECKHCGLDVEEIERLVDRLRRNVIHLDLLLWDIQASEGDLG